MEFRLSEPEPGSFQIVRMEPAVVGTFTDRATAEKIMGFLEMDAVNEARRPNAGVAPVTTTPKPKAAASLPASAEPKQAKQNPSAEKQTSVEHFDWTADELLKAFTRLEAGEPLQDVAAGFGKSWTALRARWAVRRRAQQQGTELVPVPAPQKTPAEKIASAVEELKDQEQCSLCQRYFKPSLENPHHCARCSKDT